MPLNFPIKALKQPITICINKMASIISHSMKSIIKNKKASKFHVYVLHQLNKKVFFRLLPHKQLNRVMATRDPNRSLRLCDGAPELNS